MIVTWYGVDGATYDVERSDDSEVTWDSVVEDTSDTTITDANGDERSLYRVRVHGSAIWNPPFHGTAETTPSLCRIFGYVRDANGVLFSGANVFMKFPSQRQYVQGSFYVTEEPVGTVTDASGYWYMDAPVGASVNIRIPIAHIDEDVTVPALSTVAFSSLL